MNTYELKIETKKERYAALAAKTAVKADALYQTATAELSMIPFGQPVLVGHHSERGHRALIERNHNRIGKSFEMQKTADYYATKAETLGTGGISSDDPDAVKKLTAKLETLKARHQQMKDENKLIKGAHESWELTNSSANIRSTQKRIEQLEANQKTEVAPDVQGNGWTLKEDKDENRVMFLFDAIPPEATRDILKGWGFKWSPTRGAWVRQLNNAGRYAAKMVASKL